MNLQNKRRSDLDKPVHPLVVFLPFLDGGAIADNALQSRSSNAAGLLTFEFSSSKKSSSSSLIFS